MFVPAPMCESSVDQVGSAVGNGGRSISGFVDHDQDSLSIEREREMEDQDYDQDG